MKKQRLVLAGNGMAGIRCIEEVLKLNRQMFEIVIFGSEPHPNYNRILLSSVLQGETSLDDITLNSKDWYAANGITLYTGETVVHIDTDRQRVITDRKRTLPYDKFIVATGSSPHILPIPGADKKGVYGFRTIEDCQALMSIAEHNQKAAVIGAGLLGLEAAVGLQHLGMDVSVIHHSAGIMQKQLDQTASRLLQADLERKGLTFHLEKDTVSISGTAQADGIQFKDGTSLKADLIVMAAGVRPNIKLAVSSGIAVNRGIIVNDCMQTSEPNVYAVGECAEHNGTVYGLVSPLYEQGKVLAKHICDVPCEGYQGSAPFAALKIAGIDVWSAGKVHENDRTTSISIRDEQAGIYKKALFEDDKLAGVILYGDTRDNRRFLDSLLTQRDISIVKKQLFAPEKTDTSFKSMPSSETICQCNSVTKGAIEEAVHTKDLTTVEEVKRCTKASGSCGGCKPLVEDLLRYMSSGEYTEPAGTPSFCGCTDFTEDDIIAELQREPFTTPAEVMNQLGWKTKNGCRKCMPAIQYYLEMLYPGFIQPEPAAEDICTLTPQMYGGRTNAEQLRNIADIIETYSIPDVSITHGQRLKLSGIKPADLPHIKNDLKIPAHSNEHRRTLQSVRACTCGQNRSIQQLAAQIERHLEMLSLPACISISLSCEADCTAAAIQDVGAIRTPAGWDIYIGGVWRTHARSGALFCVTDTAESTARMIKGLIQYYRETAHYEEAVHQWMDRVGIVNIREVLFEEDLRTHLLENLKTDLSLIQKLPLQTGAHKKG
ncbi:FAD-dependent oxidoreductase [Bacillus tequilensis]|uniref:nitrite reductase large subunit NirB n=1 Tax=Bacillus tequilensis TaxID=227866 RepID=UPI001575FCCC|nr:nitrite reductase large subunit NirB [Bacillus tequilensis]NTU27536.1 FAD-dependent oxidoreductase [Bacillus tequilensis]